MEVYQQRAKGPRACSTCAKAKARCIPGPDTSKCERCHRLNKQCPSQTPAPPRKRKEPKTTRVAELERRLEDLTSRMGIAQKQQQPQMPTPPESADSTAAYTEDPVAGSPSLGGFRQEQCQPRLQHFFPAVLRDLAANDSQAPPSVEAIHEDLKRRTNPWNITNTLFGASAPDPFAETIPRPAPVPTTPVPGEASLWPVGLEAEALLDEYKSMERRHLFPFLVVPPGLSSAHLRQQRPFLWKAVMMEACHLDGSRQITLGNQLLRDIAEAAFNKPQKNIDLLQGLQILISSFHYSLNSFQMTNLLYLARSICMSLGLAEGQGSTELVEPASQRLEQMRAFAGTYYLVTVIFTTNKKPDALMNTSYLDTCCRILETRMEYETDELLVWLVRTQQQAQSISLTLGFRANATLPQTSNLPISLIIKSLQQQLASFRASIPSHMRSNASLVAHQYVAEILLYEIGLQGNIGLSLTDRLEYLWACLRAVQAFFNNKFAQPLGDDQPRFICMCSFDFIYAFLTILKLVTISTPGWDLRLARKELNFDELVDKQVADMQSLADRRVKSSSVRVRADGKVEGLAQDPYRKLAEQLRMLRDALCGELDAGFTDNLAKAAETGAMTITDATQGIVEDLEGSLWHSLMGAAADWDSFDAFQSFI